jgi:hypothetical protein
MPPMSGAADAKPAPHGIAPKTVLYAFEAADIQKNGAYLGEFVVKAVTDKDKQIVIEPTTKLTPREIDRLEKAKQTWVLYEILPQDNHETFAAMSEEQKKAMIPAESLPQYLKDGKPASPDDPKECVEDGKYVRPLNDYRILLGAVRDKYMLLSDALVLSMKDKKLVDDAVAEAQKQEEKCKKDITVATGELAQSQHERDASATCLKSIEASLATVQTQIKEFIESNKAMAGQLAKIQIAAARLIDQRTRAMAQSGAGRQ